MDKGFTLLEIVMVTSIMLILALVVFLDYRGTEKDFALSRSAHKLSQDLRQGVEMAMSSQKTPMGCEQVEPGVFPKGGYGIYFVQDAQSYILFADCDNEKDYDSSVTTHTCVDAEPGPLKSLNEKIEEFFLEEGIKIKELQVDSVQVNELEITFTPPDPTITINKGDGVKAVITLCLKENEDIIRKVTINNVGLIDTE
ncbi:type II secretion system protein [Candidatus Parcubacteria bacterium]|nr:type II secretion system protein [Candidatus Parcubacteria bacterium]